MSTPRTEAAKFKSAQDCTGQTGWLCWASHAEQLEGELQNMTHLARRLLAELEYFDCDDRGQDLKSEAQHHLSK